MHRECQGPDCGILDVLQRRRDQHRLPRGSLSTASYTPAQALPDGQYVVELDPEHYLGLTDLAGNPPRRFSTGFAVRHPRRADVFAPGRGRAGRAWRPRWRFAAAPRGPQSATLITTRPTGWPEARCCNAADAWDSGKARSTTMRSFPVARSRVSVSID